MSKKEYYSKMTKAERLQEDGFYFMDERDFQSEDEMTEKTYELEGIDQETIELGLTYLDGLRESGVCNMFGSIPYVQEALDVDRNVAKRIFGLWMETFGERNPQ